MSNPGLSLYYCTLSLPQQLVFKIVVLKIFVLHVSASNSFLIIFLIMHFYVYKYRWSRKRCLNVDCVECLTLTFPWCQEFMRACSLQRPKLIMKNHNTNVAIVASLAHHILEKLFQGFYNKHVRNIYIFSCDLFPEKPNQISITENNISLHITKVKKQLMYFDFSDWYLLILGLSSFKFMLSVKFF